MSLLAVSQLSWWYMKLTDLTADGRDGWVGDVSGQVKLNRPQHHHRR